MIITGLLDSTLEEGLDVKAEGTDGGKKKGTAHRWTRTNTHASFHMKDTLFWLAVSSSSLQYTLHTPQPMCRNKKSLHLHSELGVSRKKRVGEGERE